MNAILSYSRSDVMYRIVEFLVQTVLPSPFNARSANINSALPQMIARMVGSKCLDELKCSNSCWALKLRQQTVL